MDSLVRNCRARKMCSAYYPLKILHCAWWCRPMLLYRIAYRSGEITWITDMGSTIVKAGGVFQVRQRRWSNGRKNHIYNHINKYILIKKNLQLRGYEVNICLLHSVNCGTFHRENMREERKNILRFLYQGLVSGISHYHYRNL